MELESSFKVDTDLIMTPQQLRDTYMWGVQVKNAEGVELGDDVYKFYLEAAQQEIEDYFNIKLKRQVIQETRDYIWDDYASYGFVRCSYPVCRAFYLKGMFGEAEQIVYPPEWLSTKRSNEVPEMYFRNVYLIPNVGGYTNNGTHSGVTFNGIFGANLLWRSKTWIPNYWHIRYVTGFSKVPMDIMNLMGKMASINLFHIAGDLILGAGIASFSLGIDGLSQSISSTSSATNAGYGARVLGYLDDIKRLLPVLENKYRGFTVSVL